MADADRKILIVDIWAEQGTNLHRYAAGLAAGASKYADVTLAAPYSFVRPDGHSYKVIRTFFPFSSRMKKGFVRKVIRGAEYIHGYCRLARIAKKQKYDVIQVEWPLRYKLDARLYRNLKKGCRLFVYKAHNVLPHSSGDNYIEQMREIYEIADLILIHGRNIIEHEFVALFPEFKHKLVVQRHGINEPRDLSYDIETIDPALVARVQAVHAAGAKAEPATDGNTDLSCALRDNAVHEAGETAFRAVGEPKMYLFFGDIHEDKGLDRLVEIWLRDFADSDSLLVICGRQVGSYPAMQRLASAMSACPNLIHLKGFIPDKDLNFLVSSCDIVVLPYRKAYMSNVVFACVEFSKPFLATDFGALREYADDGKDGFIVANETEQIRKKLLEIETGESREHLAEMGASLKEHFERAHRWEVIEREVVETYEKHLQGQNG